MAEPARKPERGLGRPEPAGPVPFAGGVPGEGGGTDGTAGPPAQRPGSGRGLGLGLAAIIPTAGRDQEGLRDVPLDLIRPNPSQPRRDFDEQALVALSESIRARGLLQPIVVRPLQGGRYELVAGERRLRAAGMAGLAQIPAIVRPTDEAERLELALIENMARADLNAVEEARACATLVDDLGMSKEDVARRVGRSRVAVTNLIRMLDLPDEALSMVERGELSGGHGRAILLCKDHAARLRLARDARDGGWSVRDTEQRARELEDPSRAEPSGPIVIHPDLADAIGAAEDTLSAALGREVSIRPRAGAYRVEFELDHPREGVELAERILRRNSV
ncbi:MAG: ParB family transcriptional regulator, chromosome partitioning protein [Thermoleophilaceae bacterium]|nr:ParB family transcriptional regulator, chromosome partitioning protein [Thermoleophilaceae bacterium]